MKKLTKKLGAGVIAVSIVLSSSMLAFAEDPAPAGGGTSGGSGSIEGIVKTDVYTADLPTESTAAYTYIADPQGLIRKTNAAKYSGKTFGEGTIFFENKEAGAANNYSNTSDSAKIVNKSSKNLSVKVTAKATAGTETGAAALADSNTFTGTNKEVYLGIKDGSSEKALTAAGVEMTAVLGAAPEEAYEYSYVGTGADTGYKYAIKSDVSAFKFAEYSYQITGAANDKATDWATDTALPAIEVTWAVDLTDDAATIATPEQTPANVAPSIATRTYTMVANTAIDIPVNLGNGDLAATTVSKVMDPTGVWDYLSGSDQASYDATNKKITLSAGMVDACMSANVGSIKVIFDDDAGTAIDVTLRK